MSVKDLWNKHRGLIFELLRYCIVGGVAAVVDMAANYVMLYYVLSASKDVAWAVALSVTVGFIVGLTVNYILSNIFVFNKESQKKKGKTVKAFLIYAAVGVVGYFLSVGLTLLGTKFIGDTGFWYLVLTCFVKGIVLIWNYVGRKIFVYKGD
ncbi:MAG: GtrA family protein [Clostridia bacterium]|nr:GtrA family protein [Clostridia bacterium]